MNFCDKSLYIYIYIYDLQRLLQYKIYITLYKNCWVGNVLSRDCIQWKLPTKWAKFTYVVKQIKFITKMCKNSSLKKNYFKTENTIGKLLKVNKNINKNFIKCGI